MFSIMISCRLRLRIMRSDNYQSIKPDR